MKLHLPKRLLAAVLLCISVLSTGAYAATEYGDVTYSGYIYNIAAGSSATFHDRTFSNYYQTSEGKWVSSTTWSGTGTSYYNGETQLSTTDSKPFWRYAFGDGAGKYSTLRLDGATSAVYLESQFSPYTLGGIIAEAGDGSYTLGRKGGTCAITLQAEEGQAANLTIKSSTTLSVSNGPLTVASAGVWDVAEGKTLAIGFHNGSALSNAGSVVFNGNLGTVEIKGGGTVDIHSSAMSIGSGTTLKVAAGSTLSLNTSVANSGALVLDGSSVNLTGATGEVITPTQNGFTGLRYSVTLATGSGSVSVQDVSWSFNGAASSDARYENGVVTGTTSGTVYCIVDGTVNSSTIGEAGYVTGKHVVNVAAGQSLVLNDGTVNIADVSGEGNVNVTVNTLLNGVGHDQSNPAATRATGILTVSNGATLKIGREATNGAYVANYANINSFDGVVLNDGTLWLHCNGGGGDLLKNLTVSGNGTIHIQDMPSQVQSHRLAGTTTVNGSLTLSATWKGGLSFEKLVGTGTVVLENNGESPISIGNADFGGTVTVKNRAMTIGGGTVNTVNAYSGRINITGDVTIGTLQGGASGQSNNSAIAVAENASLTATNISMNWGFSTFTVDGVINSDDFILSTGNANYTVGGAGTINTKKLSTGNVGKYRIEVSRINVGEGGVVHSSSGDYGFTNTLANNMTMGALADWSSNLKFKLDGAVTFNTENAEEGAISDAGHTITLNGVLSDSTAENSGSLVKDGNGTLILRGSNTYSGGTTINGGTVVAGNNAALGTGDVALEGGALAVAENVTIGNAVTMTGGELTVNGTASNVTANGGSVTIGDNGSVTSLTANDNVTVSGNVDASAIGIAAQKHVTVDSITKDDIQFTAADGGHVEVANTNTEDTIQYGVGESAAKVTADSLVAKSASGVTVANQLAVKAISNEGAGKLIVDGAVDGLESLAATSGDITLQKVGDVLAVTSLSIGENKTVAVYAPGAATANAPVESTLNVTETLTTATGSTLLSNLVLGDNVTLTLNDALKLGSQLTLGSGMTLDGALNTQVQALAENGSVTLIQAVDNTNLTYTGNYNGASASTYFANVGEGYQIVADGTHVAIQKTGSSPVVPEPTTGTLSLLALAGLMARRRRK